ncbi:MAG TPA: MMPL family transporter [Bacteroidales bacterium]|nr:MMPL family transporter [Bacteroidales bacterium]HNR41250.1 MMPL family transporter [Bacteroidales bacterium]HPM17366.1 MMPL family transporter [Bacteroidales bacterium]
MADFIIKYRWLIISVSLAVALSLGLLIPTVETDPEIRNFVPHSMPSRINTDSIEKDFGVQDMIIVILEDSSILTQGNLERLKEIDRGFSRLEGIGTVNSLFTARKITGEDGMMVVDPLVRQIPDTPDKMEALRRDILENRFALGIVASQDMTAAAVTGTVNPAIPEHLTLDRVDSIAKAQENGAEVLTGGLPYIRRHIVSDVNHDALILIPIALIIMLSVLKLSLGKWKSVLLPFSVVVLTVTATMGLIPLLGWKFSILSLLVPIILISVANNYGIYFVSKHQELKSLETPPGRRDLIRKITGSLNMPILFSGLTTIAGLLGLLAHSIIPARQVGVLAATGVSLALLMSLLLIPSVIWLRERPSKGKDPVRSLIPLKRKKERDLSKDLLSRGLAQLSDLVVGKPGRVLLVSAVITVVISTGIAFLRIDTNQENYFPQNHPVRKASRVINSKFGGSQTISVMVSGDIKDPVVMKKIDELTSHLKSQDGVGNVFSISDVVREMSKALYDPGENGYDKIPDSYEAIAQMFELYNMSGNPDDWKQLMNFENTRAHLLVKLSKPDNHVISALRNDIRSFTAGFPAEVTVGGYAIIMADFANKIIRGQISSLIFALVTVFVLLSVIFRSVRGGLIGSIPLGVSIIIQFGIMGYANIPIDAATALLSSIMIGVGVDFTIQYLWRYNTEFRRSLSHAKAISVSLTTTGRSIVINALSVMAGFSATFISGFLSIRYFGYLVLISIGSCLLCAIIVIPAFMLWFRPAFIEADLNKTSKNNDKYDKNIFSHGSNADSIPAALESTAV